MKTLVRRLAPPILLDAARALRAAATGREWEWVPEGWRPGTEADRGWLHPSVLDTQRARWAGFAAGVRGTGPLGLSPEAPATAGDDLAAHNTIMVFGYVLARAAHGRERISLLDWGGGLGHYYLLARALMPEATIDYHCLDTPQFAAHGRTLLPEAHFHDHPSECLSRTYDLVLASSSLQYHQDWAATLERLAGAAGRYLCVTRLPVVERAESYVTRQRPHRHGYRTEYLGWAINQGELLARAGAAGLALERVFLIGEQAPIHGGPEPCRYRGFLFQAPAGRT